MLRAAVTRSLLLCLLWISAVKAQTGRRCSKDGFNLLKTIRNKTPDWGSDTMLYTPSIEQFQKCRNTTVECLVEEMTMLLTEWDLEKTRVMNIIKVLKSQHSQQREVDCVQCEHFQEKPAQQFLNFVNTILQIINSSC